MRPLQFDRTTWKRRGRIAAISLVVFLVVVGVVGFLIAPGIVKSVAEQQISLQIGRKTTIEHVAINPYALSATIAGLKIYAPDGTSVAAQVDALYANISSASLFRRALVFDELRVTRPHFAIARLDAQRFDFSDILDKLAAQPKSDQPFRFSLNNIAVDDGSVAFDDRVTGRKHVVEHITLGLPFVSNLPYATDIFVTPKFAADVDGSHLRIDGKAQPFADDHEATIAFDLAALDLPSYVGFAPTPLRFKVASAKLDAHLVIAFRAAARAANGAVTPQSLALSGQATLADVKITDTAGHEAIAVKRIDVDVDKLAPLESVIALKRLAIVEPHIAAVRHADDSIDLVTLFAGPPSAAPPAGAASKAPPMTVSIASAVLQGGVVALTDETLSAPTTTTFDAIDVKLEHVALGGSASTAFDVSVTTPDEGTVHVDGSAIVAERKVDGDFRMRHFRPGAFAHYLATFLAARIGDGTIDADARYRIDASGPALAGRIDGISAHVVKLHSELPNQQTPFVAADAIVLEGGSYDFQTHAFGADSLVLTAPVVAIARDAKGRFNVQAALVEKAPDRSRAVAAPGAPPAGAVVVKPADAPAFTALVKSFVVERGNLSFDDDAQGVPVRVRASPFNLKVQNVGTAAGTVLPFSIDTGIDRRGKLVATGKLTVAPLAVDATINASNVAVGWLAAYSGDRLNIVVDSADLNARGTVRVETPPVHGAGAEKPAPNVSYRGSLGIARMRALDRVTSEEFVQWKTLDIPQVDFRMPTKGPVAVSLGVVGVDNFYARVIVNSNGRLNLQDVVAAPGQTQSVTTPEGEQPAQTTQPPATPPPAKSEKQPVATAAATDTAPKPVIHIAGARLTNGRIGITDNFIKPNYSANLTDLNGNVAAIASDDPKPAAVKLTGRIDGEGTLDVGGSINPLAATLYTDIAAEAKDIELTRLSPYAIKYAGYGIERGKLSMTVKYHIEDGKLEAQNRLFLDQLTFGEHDATSSANLPVRLAVALLANSKGEIDVQLPVSGSLSDPQFSIGGVLWRAFVNLITKAVTSPFSLIGAAFGGGSDGELGYIQFKPGVSDLTDAGKAKLETLAKALADRPKLKLDIIGRFDPATDPEGIQRDRLLDRMKDAKAKEQSKGGERVTRDDVTIEPGAEYAKVLAQVYDDTKFPDKPRNAIGLAKSVPVPEMERLLVANTKLDPNDPRWLADARADVVRHYIEDTGKIAPGRVFLVAPKLNADGIDDKGVPNRVDFAIR